MDRRQSRDITKPREKLLVGPPITIAMLPYPGMYLQDFLGPLTVFEALVQRDVHLVWKTLEPIASGRSIRITPTKTFDDCPDDVDILFVPGGVPDTTTLMEDREVLTFLARCGRSARYVASVYTGSLLLGAAGLLKGYKTASNESTRGALRALGALPTNGAFVVDRNRITGSGVTAGLDFGLTLVAKLRGQAYAEAVQLYLEYDPDPAFSTYISTVERNRHES